MVYHSILEYYIYLNDQIPIMFIVHVFEYLIKWISIFFYVRINVGNVFTVKHKIFLAIFLPICQNLDVGIGIQKSKIHMIRYT